MLERARALVCRSRRTRAIALGRRVLNVACAALADRVSRGVTRVAESEVMQMASGEAAAETPLSQAASSR
jgi:hypothetical protein